MRAPAILALLAAVFAAGAAIPEEPAEVEVADNEVEVVTIGTESSRDVAVSPGVPLPIQAQVVADFPGQSLAVALESSCEDRWILRIVECPTCTVSGPHHTLVYELDEGGQQARRTNLHPTEACAFRPPPPTPERVDTEEVMFPPPYAFPPGIPEALQRQIVADFPRVSLAVHVETTCGNRWVLRIVECPNCFVSGAIRYVVYDLSADGDRAVHSPIPPTAACPRYNPPVLEISP